jgi:Polysaccharide pyruvyl transferase
MRVGYYATNFGAVPADLPRSSEALMRETGQNTGNLAFWRAAAAMIEDELTLLPWNWNGRDGRDDIDVMLIPGANYLNPQWDFGHLATAIENFAKPVMIFGLGTQAQRESDDVVLKSGSVRLLQALAAHCTTLFLRGPFTAGVCARYGITNVVSAGCPSITLNPDPMLGVKIEEKIGQALRRLSCAGAATKMELQPVEQGLFDLIRRHEGSSLVLQCPADLIDLADGGPGRADDPQVLQEARDFFAPKMEPDEFQAEFARVARCFSDADAWMEDARRRDYSYAVNTRIHGTILALMAEVPSLVVGHDARIRELCSVMSVPCLTSWQVEDGLKDIPNLFRALDFDGAAFDRRRRDLARLYRDYLVSGGLTPSRNLATLCADGRRSPTGAAAAAKMRPLVLG